MGVLLILLGMLGLLFGTVNVIYPLKFLRVTSRKTGVAILGGALVTLIIGAATTPSSETSGDPVKAPVATPSKQPDSSTNAKPVATPASQGTAEKAGPFELSKGMIGAVSGLQGLTGVEIYDIEQKKGVHVHYGSDAGNEQEAMKMAATQTVMAFENLFKHPDLAEVIVTTEGTFADAYGKKNVDTIVSISYSRNTAAKIDWATFKTMVSKDYKAALRVADSYYINNSVYQNLPDRNEFPAQGKAVSQATPERETKTEPSSTVNPPTDRADTPLTGWLSTTSGETRSFSLSSPTTSGSGPRLELRSTRDYGNGLGMSRLEVIFRNAGTVECRQGFIRINVKYYPRAISEGTAVATIEDTLNGLQAGSKYRFETGLDWPNVTAYQIEQLKCLNPVQ